MKVKNNLDQILYKKIIESLIQGDYTMGQRIPLDELADRFEVSRTPVVQAVKLLSNDGVLQVMSSGRVFVPHYEYAAIRHLCDVRLLMEEYAVSYLVNHLEESQEALEDLSHYTQLCRDCCDQQQYVELVFADLKLHRALVRSTKNQILLDLFTRVQSRFAVVNCLVNPLDSRQDFQQTVEGHYAMYHAICSGNPEQASQAIRSHIRAIGGHILCREAQQA